MAKTQTKDNTTTEVPNEAPAVHPPAKADRTTWQGFEKELKDRENEIARMLPPHIDPARFHACAVAAVKQNPELLECNLRSLFQSITRSAQDGILPDGREGVINIYRTKVSKPNVTPEVWAKMAQWNPMAHGLRKRARELDKMLIDAQVVYRNDKFVWSQGDDPKIEHLPAQLGVDRGDMIGAYAIFKREDGLILAREVMAKGEIETVQEQSKSKDGLMWKKFTGEAWRKTVIRRGIKAVPVSSALQEIVKRADEEDFEFPQETSPPIVEGALVPPRPKQSDFKAPAEKPSEVKIMAGGHDVTDKMPLTKAELEKQRPQEQARNGGAQQAAAVQASQDKEGEAKLPEFLDRRQQPAAEPAAVPAQPDPEPEDIAPTEAYMNAMAALDKVEETIAGMADLDVVKKEGRINIDNEPGLTEDEREGLRGRFINIVLAEQKRRAKKGRGR